MSLRPVPQFRGLYKGCRVLTSCVTFWGLYEGYCVLTSCATISGTLQGLPSKGCLQTVTQDVIYVKGSGPFFVGVRDTPFGPHGWRWFEPSRGRSSSSLLFMLTNTATSPRPNDEGAPR